MKNEKFVIITSADSNCGDFLINHWLRSVNENINKNLVDIAILDYGLTEAQRSKINSKDIIIVPCIKDGHITNIRYRDLLNFLNKNRYEQVLSCDGGDLIFQKDITEIFFKNRDSFRAVCEDLMPLLLDYHLLKKTLTEEFLKEVKRFLKNKKCINGGLVLAPSNKFRLLCKEMNRIIKEKKIYGQDQIILNYFLYKNGFVELEKNYNFIPVQSGKKEFKIKNGIFYKGNEKIAVVHNTGYKPIFRVIKNFGYGKGYNKVCFFRHFLIRNILKLNVFLIKNKIKG